MAKDSPQSLRNLSIYQVYVRNHSERGDFQGVMKDLDRITSLGIDVLYLIPIHPVGQKNKKGELGSIYSISDYQAINPEYGTMEDFQHLIEESHRRGLKVMIDIVFNHTSHESKLFKEHPEWFYLKDGKPGNRVGDWSDIIDLDFTQLDLWKYLFKTLEMYVTMGVDGYRCDVAPLVPIDFWIEARNRVKKLNPNFIWLSESVHKSFIKHLRDRGFEAHSDCEVYQAFDILYDYDIYDHLIDYIEGRAPLKVYLDELRNQECIYPSNYTKLRNLENHDQERIASRVKDRTILHHLIGFNFFCKGAAMIYAGQEAYNTHRPSLFDRDLVDWKSYKEENCDELIRTFSKIKKDSIMASNVFNIEEVEGEEVVILTYREGTTLRYGLFNFSGKPKTVKLPIPEGIYLDLVNQMDFNFEDTIEIASLPKVFDVQVNE